LAIDTERRSDTKDAKLNIEPLPKPARLKHRPVRLQSTTHPKLGV
jgi:hypothetical protein